MSADGNSPEDIGWTLDVDAEAEELRMEHGASGNAYVFDAEGNLSVVADGDGGGAIGDELRELRSALASALGGDGGAATGATESGLQAGCRVECNQRGEVVIESDTRISLDAPAIDLAADGQLTATSSGLLTLQGSLIQLN